MDVKLVSWARAVKARRTRGRHALPVLWLFTDEWRMADPCPSVARLPRGLAGVVLRHDGDPCRDTLGHTLARICRARRLALVVTGSVHLAAALGAGMHLRNGRWPCHGRTLRGLVTSSAHGRADLHRAKRAGANLAFLSPTFPTLSHPGAVGLGSVRWSRLARTARMPVAALGGINGETVRRLPARLCQGLGAIGSLQRSDISRSTPSP